MPIVSTVVSWRRSTSPSAGSISPASTSRLEESLRVRPYGSRSICRHGAVWQATSGTSARPAPSPTAPHPCTHAWASTPMVAPTLVAQHRLVARDQRLRPVDALLSRRGRSGGAPSRSSRTPMPTGLTLFRNANDVYVDDGSLIVLGDMPEPETPPTATPEPTETPDPSKPTSTPSPTSTPAATPTPRPDGAIVHVVREGDTLGGIAPAVQPHGGRASWR